MTYDEDGDDGGDGSVGVDESGTVEWVSIMVSIVPGAKMHRRSVSRITTAWGSKMRVV